MFIFQVGEILRGRARFPVIEHSPFPIGCSIFGWYGHLRSTLMKGHVMKMGWVFMSSAGLLLCVGCAPMVTVSANGTQKADPPIPPHVTYAIFPAAEVENDPAFATYSRLIAKKMDEHGYKVSDPRTAKLAVYLAYGIKETSLSAGSLSSNPTMGGTGGMGTGAGAYGTGVSSTGTQLVRRYTSQVVIVIGDLSQSRAAGSLVELWRGETMSTGDNDLPALMPLLVEANFRHFGETTSTPVQHTFGEEEIRRLRGTK